VRSPNYPQLSLPDAIDRVRTVYKTLHTAKTDQEKIVQILGYGSLNGRSMGVLSALRKYGLLQGAGESLSVSQDAVIILERQKGHPERVAALRKAALTPPLYSELHARFGGQPPADEDLRIHLAASGFSRTATSEITKNYRETIDLVSSEDAGYTEAVTSDNNAHQELLPMQQSQDRPISEQSRSAVSYAGRSDRGAIVPLVVEPEADQELRFKISANSEARIAFRGEVTAEAIDKLIKLLELSKDTFPSTSEPRPATTQAVYDAVKEAAEAALTHYNWGVALQHIRRSQSNSKQWTLELEDGSEIVIDVAPTDTVEEIKSAVMAKLVAGEIK